MTYSESPFSQLSDELWHVFGGRRRFPTTRALYALRCVFATQAGLYIIDPWQPAP